MAAFNITKSIQQTVTKHHLLQTHTTMWLNLQKPKVTYNAILATLATILLSIVNETKAIFFPRGGSFGYLAAVAIPLDLPYRNVYMAFNFEANYGLPSNDSYNEWIDRWNIDEEFVGIGNNVTAINNRRQLLNEENERRKRSLRPRFDRRSFYRTFTGYLELFQMNGTACLLRTICEVAASSLHENNGVLGSIFKILFMPTTSEREPLPLHNDINDEELYRAEWQGRNYMTKHEPDHYEGDVCSNACMDYSYWCPEGVINMISAWY